MPRISRFTPDCLIISALLCCAHSAAYAGNNSASDQNAVEVGTGFDYTTGNYGSSQTSENSSIPFYLSYLTDHYSFDLSVPYLRQTGPAGTIAGRSRRRTVENNRVVSAEGWGDVTASVTRYLIDDEDSGIGLDIMGAVKFATANQSNGLGTGKNDYSLQADISKDYDKFSLMGSLGYSFLSSPGVVTVNGVVQNIVFNNIFYGSVSANYKISDKIKAGLTYYTAQASEAGGIVPRELTPSLRIKITDATNLRLYALKGLSNGSPDWGGGASVSASF